MPTRSDKHGAAAERVFYPGFNGGLNLSQAAENIERNELKEALNVAFSPVMGSMRTRGGLVWSGRLPFEISGGAPVTDRGFLLRKKGARNACYFRWNGVWTVRGDFSGDGPVSAAAWGDDTLLVASGGKLQRFDPYGASGLPKLSNIAGAPGNCRAVFVRNGRVGVVTMNSDDGHYDTIRFSAVGDCENWTNDPNDDSSAQFLEVGYMDGMDVDAVVPLSKDLIVFKSPENEPDKGVVWRLTGDFPDWQLLEAAHQTGTFWQESVQTVGSDAFFLTTAGLATLSSVAAYGEIKTSWPDRKVANAMSRRLTADARLWNIAVKEQLWVLPGGGDDDPEKKKIWVFDYGRGIWTQFEFPSVPDFAAIVDNMLFVIIGGSVYQVHDEYIRDEIYRTEPVLIRARMRMGVILRGLQTLIKAAFASFCSPPSSSAGLRLRGFTLPLRGGGRRDFAAGEPSAGIYASADARPLFPNNGVTTARQRCVVRGWAVTPELEITGGAFSIHTAGLETVEA